MSDTFRDILTVPVEIVSTSSGDWRCTLCNVAFRSGIRVRENHEQSPAHTEFLSYRESVPQLAALGWKMCSRQIKEVVTPGHLWFHEPKAHLEKVVIKLMALLPELRIQPLCPTAGANVHRYVAPEHARVAGMVGAGLYSHLWGRWALESLSDADLTAEEADLITIAMARRQERRPSF